MTARRLARASTLALLALLIAGCATGPRRVALAEDARVGVFTYRVLAAQWQDQIGRGERAVSSRYGSSDSLCNNWGQA